MHSHRQSCSVGEEEGRREGVVVAVEWQLHLVAVAVAACGRGHLLCSSC